jgi:hypothetical protein
VEPPLLEDAKRRDGKMLMHETQRTSIICHLPCPPNSTIGSNDDVERIVSFKYWIWCLVSATGWHCNSPRLPRIHPKISLAIPTIPLQILTTCIHATTPSIHQLRTSNRQHGSQHRSFLDRSRRFFYFFLLPPTSE